MNTYLLYDPALNGAYMQLILQQQYPIHYALFAGTKDEALADVSPWLFQIDDAFGQKIMQQPLIELQATILLAADADPEALAAHLRQFIYQTINGREYFFRFWDARVLEKFLPDCSKEQIKTFFEGLFSITAIYSGDQGQAMRYQQERGRLQITMIPIEEVFKEPADTSSSPMDIMQTNPEEKEAPKKGRTFLS